MKLKEQQIRMNEIDRQVSQNADVICEQPLNDTACSNGILPDSISTFLSSSEQTLCGNYFSPKKNKIFITAILTLDRRNSLNQRLKKITVYFCNNVYTFTSADIICHQKSPLFFNCPHLLVSWIRRLRKSTGRMTCSRR